MDRTKHTPHNERLNAPPGWWLVLIAFALVVGWLLLVAMPPAVALAVAAAVAIAGGTTLARQGAVRVVAEPGVFRAGEAHLEDPHLGAVTALDPDAWRTAQIRAGVDHAFLLTRPWIDRGVRVDVCDPTDPTPYWLVSTRHPEAVARAVGHTGAEERTDQTSAGGTSDGPQEAVDHEDPRQRGDHD